MNRQPQLTKRSVGHRSLRLSMGGVVLPTALLVAACSDDSSSGTPTFATSTDTSSSSAPSTTSSNSTPTTNVTTPTPSGSTTQTTTIPPTTPPTTPSSTSSSTGSNTLPGETTWDDETSLSAATNVDESTLPEVPTFDLHDGGVDASVSSETDGVTSESAITTDAVTEVDASVTEEGPQTTEAVDPTSAPEVTTESQATSAVEESTAGEDTSDALPYGPNLLTNSGFEGANITGWYAFGGQALVADTTLVKSGTYSVRTDGRSQTWNGIATDVVALVLPGKTYHVAASVSVQGATNEVPVKLTFKVKCGTEEDQYPDAATGTASNGVWTDLSGNFTVPACASTVTELVFYVQGPPSGVELYLDDASIREVL